MKRIAFFSLVLILSSLMLQAQRSKVTSGILALDSGDPLEAISKIEEGIQDKSQFEGRKAKHLAKGYYYLAKAYLTAVEDTTVDVSMLEDPTLKAAEYYQMAMDHPDKKIYENDAVLNNVGERIWYMLYSRGIETFNNREYVTALDYFEAATEAKPDFFLNQRMLGSTYLLLADERTKAGENEQAQQDTANSIEALEAALTIFEEKYYEGEDEEALAVLRGGQEFQQDSGQISYTVQQLALLYDQQGESLKALETIERGLAIAPEDKDVKRMELNIYQNNPNLLEKAKEKFEAAIQEDPDDLAVKMAYASLLERNGEAEYAQQLYQEAYDVDPDNLQANYGLGAFYVNRAAELSQEKAEMTGEEEVAEIDERILALLKKAYPYIKKLHELQPDEPEWLKQLVSITGNLGLDEEMAEYGKKLGDLRN